jgi:hypothetical protein
MFVHRALELSLLILPISPLPKAPPILRRQDHVRLALVGALPRLVRLRLQPRRLLPVDGKLGQDLERGALSRRTADLGKEQPPELR